MPYKNKELQKESKKKYHDSHREQASASSRKYYASHKEEVKEKQREYMKTHKRKCQLPYEVARERGLLNKYGISVSEYDLMYVTQDGKCAICKKHCDVLYIDHNHLTRQVRGLLCHKCNVGIGMLHDDKGLVFNAFLYLGGGL